MISITVPYPPSMNGYWRNLNGRTLISKKGRLFRIAVNRCVLQARANRHLTGRLNIEVHLYPPDRRRRDIDNAAKPLLDCLQHAGVYLDDAQVDRLVLERRSVEKGGVAVVLINEAQPIRK